MGKKTFIYSQGIGPISDPRNRRLTAATLRRTSGIVVRDAKSRDLLLETPDLKDPENPVFDVPDGSAGKVIELVGVRKGEMTKETPWAGVFCKKADPMVLQALDAAGKDSMVKHVMGGLNPQGVSVHSFKQPNQEELAHDFLWRVNRVLPARGHIAIFNRSYYEDVLVVQVHDLQEGYRMAPRVLEDSRKEFFRKRYRQIRDYEEYLYENSYRIVKILLNVSKEKQRERFLERIETPEKNWKFSPDDLRERRLFDEYLDTFDEVVNDYCIDVAAPVVPDVDFLFDEKHGIMRGKAFDNRLGCASIVSTLDAIRGEELKVDVVGAFASQEEVGTRGATVTVEHVRPDLAICFEGCPADDTVVPAYQSQTAIGKGPMLRYIDGRMITNPRFQRYALSLAKELGLPFQAAVRTGGATDGAPIHLGFQGVPVIVIGIPVRYVHTHYGYASKKDYDNGVELAAEILRRMDLDTIRSF